MNNKILINSLYDIAMTEMEKILSEAFWELLEEKPYKKITVKDIVDRCQVNRNTFYYHFDGITTLFEEALIAWEEKIFLDISRLPLPERLPIRAIVVPVLAGAPEPEIVPETGEVVEESTKKRGRKKGGNTESMDALFFEGKEE